MKTTKQKPELKHKARVRVYQKPLTRENYEGLATLHAFQQDNGNGWQRWTVTFAGEAAKVHRVVHADDLVEGNQHPRVLPKSRHRINRDKYEA